MKFRTYKNQVNLLILCDLSKAFDSVKHKFNLKLVNHKTDTFWFSSYLDTISQSVRINGIISSGQPIYCGVP